MSTLAILGGGGGQPPHVFLNNFRKTLKNEILADLTSISNTLIEKEKFKYSPKIERGAKFGEQSENY